MLSLAFTLADSHRPNLCPNLRLFHHHSEPPPSMISVVLSVTLLGVAAAQEPAPVASSVANTERFGLCAAPATAPRVPRGTTTSKPILGSP